MTSATVSWRSALAARPGLLRRLRDGVKEYLFLATTTAAAVLYAILHDHITATISPEYFLYGKGLLDDPRPFRLAVTILAAKASYSTGLLAGLALLLANNPMGGMPRLEYARLLRIASVPVAAAFLLALLGAAIVPWYPSAALEHAIRDSMGLRFVLVWAIHLGSYVGAVAGTLVGVVVVYRARREMAQLEDFRWLVARAIA